MRTGSRRPNYRRKTMAKAGQSGLDAIAAGLPRENRGPPPVELWNPPYCGDIDMKIAADGTWFYQKTPIGRLPLVKLFASVLKREGDKHFLVTPVEKVGIVVEDAPFLVRRSRAGPRIPYQCRRLVGCRARPCIAVRNSIGNGRTEAVPACAARLVGESHARAVL